MIWIGKHPVARRWYLKMWIPFVGTKTKWISKRRR